MRLAGASMPRESKPSGEPSQLAVKRRLGVTEITIKKRRTWRQVKQLVSNEYFDLLPVDAPTFSSIEAPPSMLPPKKYCDITGFPVSNIIYFATVFCLPSTTLHI